MNIPPEIQELFGELMQDIYTLRYKGKPVQFKLSPKEHTYLYFNGKNGKQHCYTPHPSTDGDYFVWDYIPKNKGARFVMKNLVRCAHRKTAKAKAFARASKADK